jgi:hypothetical protein
MDAAKYPGKNQLWALWKNADRLIYTEVRLELEKAGIYRYWKDTASKENYDLSNAKGKLIQIFKQVMPDTAPLFGLPAPKRAAAKMIKTPSPAPLFDNQ